jgi:hypothetical protein
MRIRWAFRLAWPLLVKLEHGEVANCRRLTERLRS